MKNSAFYHSAGAAHGQVRRLMPLLLSCLVLGSATPALAEDKKEGGSPDAAQDAQPVEIEVSAAEVAAFLKDANATLKGTQHEPGKKPQVLDVRTLDEFKSGHVPGARNADFLDDSFKAELAKLDKSKPYIVHCAAGGRSAKAAAMMKSLGFAKIYHMKEGFTGWQKIKGPIETTPDKVKEP